MQQWHCLKCWMTCMAQTFFGPTAIESVSCLQCCQLSSTLTLILYIWHLETASLLDGVLSHLLYSDSTCWQRTVISQVLWIWSPTRLRTKAAIIHIVRLYVVPIVHIVASSRVNITQYTCGDFVCLINVYLILRHFHSFYTANSH